MNKGFAVWGAGVLTNKIKRDSLPRKNIGAGLGRWRCGVLWEHSMPPTKKIRALLTKKKYKSFLEWHSVLPHKRQKDSLPRKNIGAGSVWFLVQEIKRVFLFA
jgi:hypothetical protein